MSDAKLGIALHSTRRFNASKPGQSCEDRTCLDAAAGCVSMTRMGCDYKKVKGKEAKQGVYKFVDSTLRTDLRWFVYDRE